MNKVSESILAAAIAAPLCLFIAGLAVIMLAFAGWPVWLVLWWVL